MEVSNKTALKLNFQKVLTFIRKLHWKEFLGLVFLVVALYFFRQQRKELLSLSSSLKHTNLFWLTAGVAFTGVYILLQAGLYVYSFLSIGGKISWRNAIELFLKRNVISVFLPAGGITALAYLPASMQKSQVYKQQAHQGSVIYGFIGIFSVFIVAVPVLLYLSVTDAQVPGATAGLFTIVTMLAAMASLALSIQKKGKLYSWVIKGRPRLATFLNEVFSFNISWKQFLNATLASVFIEIVGIIHLYISMLAAGATPSLEAAVTGYIVAAIFLIISPFLRGMGAVELSLTVILGRYGFTTLHALEITLLFRFFEFWLPLVGGLVSYAAKGRHLFLRLLPPVLIFILGLVNLFSVLTPPAILRLRWIHSPVQPSSIAASGLLVIAIGLSLIFTAAFLIKGLRSAWLVALGLSVISVFRHLAKPQNYRYAILALFVSIVLIITRKRYRVKSNCKQ